MKTLLGLLFLMVPIAAQVVSVPEPQMLSKRQFQQLLTTTPTRISIAGKPASASVYLLWASIVNEGSTGATVTIQDGNGATLFRDTPIAAGTTWNVPLSPYGLLFTQGILVSASTTNVRAWISLGVR